jgi:hypothetical protein
MEGIIPCPQVLSAVRTCSGKLGVRAALRPLCGQVDYKRASLVGGGRSQLVWLEYVCTYIVVDTALRKVAEASFFHAIKPLICSCGESEVGFPLCMVHTYLHTCMLRKTH